MKIENGILLSLTDEEKNLKTITIPESVTAIGSYAFYNCENLQSITIPSSVTTIESYAFKNCKNLKRPSKKIRNEIIEMAKKEIFTHNGLCSCLDFVLNEMSKKYGYAISIASCFPKFQIDNAVKYFHGKKIIYWWDTKEKEIRIKFLDFINK